MGAVQNLLIFVRPSAGSTFSPSLSPSESKVIDFLELPFLSHLFFKPRAVVGGAEDENHGVLHVVNDLDALELLNVLRPAISQIHEPVLGLWLSSVLLTALLILRSLRARLDKRIVVFAVHVWHYLCKYLLQVDFFEHLLVQLKSAEKDVQAPLIDAVHDKDLLLPF